MGLYTATPTPTSTPTATPTPSLETTTAALSGGRRVNPSARRGYFFGIIDPVCRYRVWKLKASSNMWGECRPAEGFFMARFT